MIRKGSEFRDFVGGGGGGIECGREREHFVLVGDLNA